MPRVLAALCSRFIFIKFLSFVGVWSISISCNASVFDEPDPLKASPEMGYSITKNHVNAKDASVKIYQF